MNLFPLTESNKCPFEKAKGNPCCIVCMKYWRCKLNSLLFSCYSVFSRIPWYFYHFSSFLIQGKSLLKIGHIFLGRMWSKVGRYMLGWTGKLFFSFVLRFLGVAMLLLRRKSVVCYTYNNLLHSSVFYFVLRCMSQNIGVGCKNGCN